MAVNVAEYLKKLQSESLATIKQAQEANITALSKLRDLTTEFSEKPGTIPTLENIPSPTQVVEMTFGWSNQLLELSKGYTLKVAEMLVDAQKRTEEAVKSATATVTSTVTSNANGSVAPANKPAAK
jgi:hypothetical protein